MKNYLLKSTKSKQVHKLINEALDILDSVGVPFNDKTERNLVRMAVCFLAVADVVKDWKKAKSIEDNVHLKTRDIINIINKNYEENISSGSYDNIRRKDLKLLVLANLVINTGANKGSATNDPTRGYALNDEFKKLIVTYNSDGWKNALIKFTKNKPDLSEILLRKRTLEKIPVKLPNGKPIELSLGDHNKLQKEIIEQFLPRFGNDCEVLYIGDTSNKTLYIETDELKKLNFFELSHDELPDIIAYSRKNNWLYLIEAVHSNGPMSETRVFELKKLLKKCPAELIFVTAFLSRNAFAKWFKKIAWETEVWTADNYDHLVHFNGNKFLGPYKTS